MRVLVVCESPPTADPSASNGSTLIPAEVVPRLPADMAVDLVWFADRRADPSEAVLERCQSVVRLELRPERGSYLAQPFTPLPRATWQRAGGDSAVRALAAQADVVYLHGLHTFSSATRGGLRPPVVAHEVDPWSHYGSERAAGGAGLRRAYDRSQARRATRLERRVADRAARYVVVNCDDAALLGAALGRQVDAVPNGVDLDRLTPRDDREVDGDVICGVGTLDYPPNVAAVQELCREVLPLVRAQRPQTRLVLAGRRPTAAVLALAGDDVQVLGPVDDVRDVFARAAVALYPGDQGRGTKNTVLEALAVGCPVVCSPEAARGHEPGSHLTLGRTPEELSARVVELLDDPARRADAGRAGAAFARALPSWDRVAATYADLLRRAAGPLHRS